MRVYFGIALIGGLLEQKVVPNAKEGDRGGVEINEVSY